MTDGEQGYQLRVGGGLAVVQCSRSMQSGGIGPIADAAHGVGEDAGRTIRRARVAGEIEAVEASNWHFFLRDNSSTRIQQLGMGGWMDRVAVVAVWQWMLGRRCWWCAAVGSPRCSRFPIPTSVKSKITLTLTSPPISAALTPNRDTQHVNGTADFLAKLSTP